MEGIEILQTIEVVTHNDAWAVGIIVFGVLFICFLVFILSNLDYGAGNVSSIFLLASLLIFVAVCVMGHVKSKKIEYEYLVTIDENVRVVEFFNKYEVIDHSDRLYTIKERNNDNTGKQNYE